MTTTKTFPPWREGQLFLTDGGIETEITYKWGFELPYFAMYPLLDDADAMAVVRGMYRRHLDVVARYRLSALMGGLDYRSSLAGRWAPWRAATRAWTSGAAAAGPGTSTSTRSPATWSSPGGGGPVRVVAGLRPGGRAAVRRAAPLRGRHDQVGPRPDHRRRRQLALPERARARAEGVTARSG
jgi:hypothetical protein